MNPSNPAKFGIAFAAGLVVALAGVTVYVRTSGIHVQEAPAVAQAVQQTKQPETLTPAKVEEAAAVVQTPAPVQPPPVAIETPKPAVAPSNPHLAPTHIARAHFPPRSFPKSQSTIRVEISQIRQPTEPTSASAQTPVPVPAVEPVRTVDEYQPVPPASDHPPAATAPQPHVVTLQAGTNLVIRLGETLSTDHNFSGDTFRATLDRPIILDGFVIAEKGSKVLGKVAGLDKAGKFEGTSNLQLALTEINTTDGQRVHIQTGFVNRKGPLNNGAEAAKIGGGAVLGALIGGLAGGGKGAAIGAGAGGAIGAGAVIAGKGRPAVVPTETELTFQLANATTITEQLN